MRFALLGPLEVHDESGPVEIRGGLRRTMLAALLLHHATVVSADRLSELMWGENPPNSVTTPLYNQATRLRQSLGAHAGRLRAVPPGYQLDVEPGELDLAEFAEHYAAGRSAAVQGRWADSAERYAAALDLWRGEPLSDIPPLEHHMLVQKLQEEHLHAWQGRIEADLNLGRHDLVVSELFGLVEAHPLREAFHGQLMLALHRSARQAEALDAYRTLRTSMVDELGVEPGAQLTDLYRRILNADESLAVPAEAAYASSLNAVPRTSIRQLPADTRIFSGRGAELEKLTGLAESTGALDSGTVVISAINGMGGVGKTALAVRVAHRVRERFPDGQLFIDLRGYATDQDPVAPDAALEYLLRSLGVAAGSVPLGAHARTALYRSRLDGTRTLILLDNAANAAQIRPLLPATSGCLVLITSRNRMTSLEDAHLLALDVLPTEDAVVLLREVAGPGRVAEDDPALAELIELCAGMPLALRIVGARLRHRSALTVASLAAELREEHGRLERLSDGERELTSVFESSLKVLPEPEQRLFRLLGLVPGPDFDAYAVANLIGADFRSAERWLESLLDQNLLSQPAAGRFQLHDLLRTYARTLTVDEADESAALDRLLRYYQHVGQATHEHVGRISRPGAPIPETPARPVPALRNMSEAQSWLRTEQANIMAALSVEGSTAERKIGLAAAFAEFFRAESTYDRRLTALHLAAADAARVLGERLFEANALWDAARSMHSQHDNADSVPTVRRALAIYQELGDALGEANALSDLSWSEYRDGSLDRAAELDKRALAIYQSIGDKWGEAQAVRMLGSARHMQGRYAEAKELHEQAATIIRAELGDPLGEGIMFGDLGRVQLITGVYADAAANLERATALFREVGSRSAVAVAWWELGRVRLAEGRYDEAIEHLDKALSVHQDTGDRQNEGYTLWSLGRARFGKRELTAAEDCQSRSLQVFMGINHLSGKANATHDLGRVRHVQGRPDEASKLFDQALEMFRACDDRHGEAEVFCSAAALAAEVEGPDEAIAAYQRSLELAEAIGSPTDTARALLGIARCEVRLGSRDSALERATRAAELFRWAGAGEAEAAVEYVEYVETLRTPAE